MTLWSENADRFATRPGSLLAHATADDILATACDRAVEVLRDSENTVTHAALLLAGAQKRAERLLQTAAVPTSTPGAAARPGVSSEGEAESHPVTYLERRSR